MENDEIRTIFAFTVAFGRSWLLPSLSSLCYHQPDCCGHQTAYPMHTKLNGYDYDFIIIIWLENDFQFGKLFRCFGFVTFRFFSTLISLAPLIDLFIIIFFLCRMVSALK